MFTGCSLRRIKKSEKPQRRVIKKSQKNQKKLQPLATQNADHEINGEIMGRGKSTQDQMKNFLLKYNRSLDEDLAEKMAYLYVEESEAEGVNHDVAFIQMCLETSFLRFGNQVKVEQNNFAGMGATDDGAAGLSFPTIRIGIRAHIQHLKGYASSDDMNQVVVDPRLKYVKRGIAPTVDDLAGRWASDRKYGIKIRKLIQKLYSM